MVTFRTTTTDHASGWIGPAARPRSGVTRERFRATLMKIVNAGGPDIIEGGREMPTTGELIGGTVIHPDQPAAFTRKPATGRCFLSDQQHIDRLSDARDGRMLLKQGQYEIIQVS